MISQFVQASYMVIFLASFLILILHEGGNVEINQITRNTTDGKSLSRGIGAHVDFIIDPAIQECIKWVNAPDPSVNYNAAYERMTDGTGLWLLQDQRLMKWKSNGGLLWLQGKGII
jgi:hypothetical protein